MRHSVERERDARGVPEQGPFLIPKILLISSGLMLIGAAFVHGGAIAGVVVTGLVVALGLFVRILIKPRGWSGAGGDRVGAGGAGAGFVSGDGACGGDGGGGGGAC